MGTKKLDKAIIEEIKEDKKKIVANNQIIKK